MKDFDKQNYYEILKIPVNSSSFEIKQAYKDALSIYDEDALATYSLFSNHEREKIIKAIEEAFLILTDKSKRAAYDSMLADSGKIDMSIISEEKRKEPTRIFHSNTTTNSESIAEKVSKKIKQEKVEKLSNEILSKDLISGNDLKNLRKAAEVELSEINAITRISVSVIKSIEENQFESLPPELYLTNFLRTYAEILQIDPQKIVDSYLKNISLAQKND